MIVVGAGPVGLATAIHVAQQDVPVVLVDDDGSLSTGSRAICFSKRSLDIFQAYAQRLAQIRADGIDTAISRPVPGIRTLAAPVLDHTGSICLVLALMGTSGNFDSDMAGGIAQILFAATSRLSRRFGWIAADSAKINP